MAKGKRESILKAAVRVFAREGFFKSRVEAVAKEAGVATGTTYLYFENKDDILISIFDEEMAPIIDGMRNEIAEQKNAVDKIRTFIRRHLVMVQEQPDMAQLLIVELRQSNKFLHTYSGTKFKEYLNIIATIFEEGQKEGVFRQDIKSTIFKQVMFGAVDQISTNWALSRTKKIDLNETGEQIADIILNGVFEK
jgi:TetR/AcrR family transcriptional regulator, fatty acid metabolism regulator protein